MKDDIFCGYIEIHELICSKFVPFGLSALIVCVNDNEYISLILLSMHVRRNVPLQ